MLWLVVTAAVVLTGFSTRHTTPAATHTVPFARVLAVADSTDRGAVTGEVCDPVKGGPWNVKVNLILYADGDGTTIARQSVLNYSTYLFDSVAPGSYVIVGLVSDNEVVTANVRLMAGHSLEVNLGTCLATVPFSFRPAKAAEVQAFLTRQSNGNNHVFSATYRYLGGPNYYGNAPPVGHNFFFAQNPLGKDMQPLESGEFVYVATYRGATLKVVQRDNHDYECLRNKPQGRWLCQGPPWGSIGSAMQLLSYDETALITDRMPTRAGPNQLPYSFVATGTLNGLSVTCLRFEEFDGTRATWCITRQGVTAFVSSTQIDGVELLKLSPSIPAGIFSLPSPPKKWNGFIQWPT